MTYSCFSAPGLLVAACVTRVMHALVLSQLVRDPSPDASAPHGSATTGSSHAGEAFQGKRVAIIFRGETFRYGHTVRHVKHRSSCAKEAEGIQTNCTKSVIKRIIEPMERRGSNVTVFFGSLLVRKTRLPNLEKVEAEDQAEAEEQSELGECQLDNVLMDALQANSSRVITRRSFSTTGQADTVLQTMQAFDEQHGGVEAVSRTFDYIMLIRNDMYWFQPIDEIKATFDQINVLSRCAPGMPRNVGGPLCVHDTFWMVPGSMYRAFRFTLGVHGCFQRRKDPISFGHACEKPMLGALARAGHAGKFGWLEPGKRHVRTFTDPRLNPGSHIADVIES